MRLARPVSTLPGPHSTRRRGAHAVASACTQSRPLHREVELAHEGLGDGLDGFYGHGGVDVLHHRDRRGWRQVEAGDDLGETGWPLRASAACATALGNGELDGLAHAALGQQGDGRDRRLRHGRQ